MRPIYIILLFISFFGAAFGQSRTIDSVKNLLMQSGQDTTKVLLLAELAGNYQFFKSDTAMVLGRQAIALARKLRFAKGEVRALTRLGEVLRLRGEFPQALQEQFKALQLSRETGDREGEADCLLFASPIYIELGEYRRALQYLFEAKKTYEQLSQPMLPFALSNIGYAYEKMNKLDSAAEYQQQALAAASTTSGTKPGYLRNQAVLALILTRLGIIKDRLGHSRESLNYYRQALQTTIVSGDLLNKARSQYQIAEVYFALKQPDSALWYARAAFADAQKITQKTTLLNAGSLLAKLYKNKRNSDSALYYHEIEVAVKDSLFGPEKFRQLQLLALSEQQRVEQLREQQVQLQRIILLSALGIILLTTLLLWRNIRYQQKAYTLLQKQKGETDQQRAIAEQTLEELRATQAQLILAEKMASLGELTAGIAHEIQNPLNFVNNFSEVNRELIDELQNELKTGDTEEAISLSNEIKENEQKINHHGKRADAIVKGMLQHSRATSNRREPIDINALADEYLRLSYHGLRAKDKSFKAIIETHFDESIGKIEVIPQDIGRVLLNLFNNAFYAVTEKKKAPALKGENYEPTVSVSTKRENDKVLIVVRDNGTGIPQKAVDKIFQPFFTTKPTGQGTGLGLSLSYDIIKAHSGELRVETKEGEGAEFIIELPAQ